MMYFFPRRHIQIDSWETYFSQAQYYLPTLDRGDRLFRAAVHTSYLQGRLVYKLCRQLHHGRCKGYIIVIFWGFSSCDMYLQSQRPERLYTIRFLDISRLGMVTNLGSVRPHLLERELEMMPCILTFFCVKWIYYRNVVVHALTIIKLASTFLKSF